MKPANEKNEALLTTNKTRLSIAILIALASLSENSGTYASPGEVCSDGTLPTSPHTCSNGVVIPTNYVNSPILRKFVDTLPGLTPAAANTFADGTQGAYIPIAVADSMSYPGSHYYELAVVEYSQKMHSDLPKPSMLRGYVQIDRSTTNSQTPATPSDNLFSLKYPDGSQIYVAKEKGEINGVWDHSLDKDALGNPIMVAAIAFDKPHYLGPAIVATRGVPTRIKMNNLLPKGHATTDSQGKVTRNGDLFLPVDEALPGAGNSTIPLATFPQNRIAIHLHGGDNPWISDGTPLQWFSAETDPTIDPSLKRGNRSFNVPDMPYPGEAAVTLFWPNNQSARLAWYHDHAFGITRQNVYAGEAAPYLITDTAEDAALGSAVPSDMLALVLQDKTFVPYDIAAQDNKWDQAHWGAPGDLWYQHVYEPNILDHDPNTGQPLSSPLINPAGRWDYGPTASGADSTPAVLPLPDGSYGQVSSSPEVYTDTAMVNGVAYPSVTVEPKAYRVHFLNGASDRYFNLSLWVADSNTISVDGRTHTEVKMVPEIVITGVTVNNAGNGYKAPLVLITDNNGYGSGAIATAQVDNVGRITGITLIKSGSGYSNPQIQISDVSGTGASVSFQLDESRPGGIPDPEAAGPNIINFANEAGLLPHPIVHKPKAMDLDKYNSETGGGFYLANAERGDTVIDFSQYAGKTLILYNDSTAPVPDGDPRYDYYTGDLDQRTIGGAPSTHPGYGPNTRTLMQIKVASVSANGGVAQAYDPNGNGGPLATVLPTVYEHTADPHIDPSIVADGKPSTITLEQWKAAHKNITLVTKTIEGGFDVNFGRLIANFGIELPGQNKPTPLAYIDSPSDIIQDGKVQYWHIENNDADNHPIHFHLFNVQVIARVDHETGRLINPNPDEAGWKETVQNWPFEDIIVALKPKTPALPFGLPDSVRLMDPVLNTGDYTNTSLDQNYSAANVSPSSIPLIFQQYDLLTGAFIPPVNNIPSVVNDIKNYGWEYTFHCHILGHEENDLMRPIKFLPKPAIVPPAPKNVALDTATGKLTWRDPTPAQSPTTKGNPANEIGFRVEYASKIHGVVGPFTNAIPVGGLELFTIIPNNTLSQNLKSNPTPKINALANAVSFNIDSRVLPQTDLVYRVVAVNQAGETPSTPVSVAYSVIAPIKVAAFVMSTGTVDLSWVYNAVNESGFTLQRATSPDFSTGLVNTKIPSVKKVRIQNYVFKNVPRGSYYFRVQATNALWTSNWATSVAPITVP